MKHPHYEVMMEWAQDTSKVVQWRRNSESPWVEAPYGPAWTHDYEYRIKPEKKPDVVHFWNMNIHGGAVYTDTSDQGNLLLVFDGDTGKLITAEVLHAER